MRRAALTVLLPLALTMPAAAVAGAIPAEPEFEILRPSNTGIPGQSDVLTIRFAPDGRLWVTARDQFWLQGGLGILDVEPNLWDTHANWQTPLPEWNYDVEFDSTGAGWLAGDEALNRFDGESFTTFDASNSPLAGDRNWDVAITPDDHVWVANSDINQTIGGLYEFDGSTWTHHDEPFMNTYFGTAAPFVVGAQSTGEVWACFEFMAGMAHWDGQSWTHRSADPVMLHFDEDASGRFFAISASATYELVGGAWQQIGPYGGTQLHADAQGRVWIGGGSGVVRVYESGSWSVFSTEPSRVSGIDTRGDEVWISIKTQVRRYDANTGVGQRIYNSVNTGIPEYLMSKVYRDRDGQMWFVGSESGISFLDGTDWRNFGAYNGDEEVYPYWLSDGSLQSEPVKHVLHDSHDNIWLIANGIARSPKSDLKNWDFWYWQNADVPATTCDAVAEDRNGDVWIGHAYGVQRFDNGDWQSHLFYPDSATSTFNDVRHMITDANGDMWAGVYAGRAHRWDGQTWTQFDTTNSTLQPGVTRAMAAAPNGDIWIGKGEGLHRFDGTSWQHFTTANSGLTENNISAIAVRDDGLVAVTCEDLINWPYDGALVLFDGAAWTVFDYGSSGYPFYQSQDLEFDANGDLWIINVNNGGVRVGLGAPPCPADLNGDGFVDFTDLNARSAPSAPPTGCPATWTATAMRTSRI